MRWAHPAEPCWTLIEGKSEASELAEMSKGLLRNKGAELGWPWKVA